MKIFENSHGVSVALLIVTILLISSSCSREKADMSDLMGKVPASAGMVMGINVKNILEEAGCEVKGTEIKPGKEVQEWLASNGANVGTEAREQLEVLFSGESGVDPSGAVVFYDGGRGYLSGILADTPKFEQFVNKQNGGSFANENGVQVNGNVAIAGGLFWVNLTSTSSIDAAIIKSYSELSEDRSFASRKVAKDMISMSHDLSGWAGISSVANSQLSFQDAALVSMISGIAFEDATSIVFDADFLKGKMSLTASVLNSKDKNAKYLLPLDKISEEAVKNLGVRAELVGAMTVDKKLVKTIGGIGSSFGGGFSKDITSMLSCVDGTVGIALGEIGEFENFGVIVSTDGNPNLDLLAFLSKIAPTQRIGNMVKIAQGKCDDGILIEEAAELLKDASVGVVCGNVAGTPETGIKRAALLVKPKDGSAKLSLEVEGVNPDENILITMMKK